MSGSMSPAADRRDVAGDCGSHGQSESETASEARLHQLVELYRHASGDDLRQLVVEDHAKRLLQAWEGHLAGLRVELTAINAALDGTGIRLEESALEPGAGVSYIACVEVRIVGDALASCPSAFAALTRRAEARLQIRMPGNVRHEARFVPLAEVNGRTWKDWLLDLLEANRAWLRAPP